MELDEITPKAALEAITNGSHLFVDVRTDEELEQIAYGVNHIHIPLDDIQERMGELPKDKNLIIGCRSGGRSAKAYLLLKMQGYAHLYNLKGGMIAWQEQGCPVT